MYNIESLSSDRRLPVWEISVGGHAIEHHDEYNGRIASPQRSGAGL